MRRLGWACIVVGSLVTGLAVVEVLDPLYGTYVGVMVALLGLVLVHDHPPADRRRPGYITERPRRER